MSFGIRVGARGDRGLAIAGMENANTRVGGGGRRGKLTVTTLLAVCVGSLELDI